MFDSFIGIHASFGELGALAFLWAFVELLNPTPQRTKRATIAAWIGLIAILTSWVFGGFYYVDVYGVDVKPIIKAGPSPWAHSVIMEAKEHLFLFLPFLAALAVATLHKGKANKSALKLCGLIVLLAFLMAGFGFLISSGYRDALEIISI